MTRWHYRVRLSWWREINRFPLRGLRSLIALWLLGRGEFDWGYTPWLSDSQPLWKNFKKNAAVWSLCYLQSRTCTERLSYPSGNTVWPEIFNNSTLCKYSRLHRSHTGTGLELKRCCKVPPWVRVLGSKTSTQQTDKHGASGISATHLFFNFFSHMALSQSSTILILSLTGDSQTLTRGVLIGSFNVCVASNSKHEGSGWSGMFREVILKNNEWWQLFLSPSFPVC